MTAQMPEKVLYQGSEYALILWEEDQLFTPERYGIEVRYAPGDDPHRLLARLLCHL